MSTEKLLVLLMQYVYTKHAKDTSSSQLSYYQVTTEYPPIVTVG